LTGNVIKDNSVLFSKNSIDFGTIPIGQNYKNATVLIQNTGNATITLNAIDFSSSELSTSTQFPVEIQPGSTAIITIKFSPDTIGDFNATATFMFDDTTLNYSIPVKAKVINSEVVLQFTVNGIYIDSLKVYGRKGNSATTTFQIYNPTAQTINIQSIDVPDGYTLYLSSMQVEAGSSINATLYAEPFSESGSWTKRIVFKADNGNSTEFFTLPVIFIVNDYQVTTNQGSIVPIQKINIPYATKPDEVVPVKTIAFNVLNVNPAIPVNITISTPTYVNGKKLTFYKILPSGEWYKLPDSAVDYTKGEINLSVIDNGDFDLDKNLGIVTDPIVGTIEDSVVSPDVEAGAGGGAGCSLSSSISPLSGIVNLLFLSSSLLLLRRRKRDA